MDKEIYMNIDDIIVKDRYRKDYGNIKELSDSIKKLGLLEPIGIDKDNNLIYGDRRLQALKQLGIEDLEEGMHFIYTSDEDLKEKESDENVRRKDYTLIEAVAIWDDIEKLPGGRGKTRSDSEQVSDQKPSKQAADRTGYNPDTLSKVKQVLESDEEDLKEKLRNTNKANKSYNELKKRQKKKEIADKAKDYQPEDNDIQIIHGDFRKECKNLDDESIDLILTDPPYPEEYLPLWEDLAEMASKKLKPSGFCIAYCGHIHLDKVMEMMSNHLNYYWIIALKHQKGGVTKVNSRNMICEWKPILIFYKGPLKIIDRTIGDVIQDEREKGLHEWQQSEKSFKYLLDFFSEVGDAVLDPFAGSGTVPKCCKDNKRKCIAIDIDKENIDIIKGRLVD